MLDYSSDAATLPVDPLSRVLQDLRITDNSYGRCTLKRPWGIEFPVQPQARFHFVVSGDCWLRAPKRGWMELQPGDVVLLPHGTGHALADKAGARMKIIDDMPLDPLGDRVFEMRAGGRGAETVLVCCSVGFDQPAMHPMLELMPPMLLVKGGGRDPLLPSLLDAMAEEVTSRRVGAATVMTRLADVVITRMIRAWVESRAEDTKGWLAAIRDPQIGRALAAIHQQPGERWSVETLADVARTSRSVFAERFASIVGTTPARYLHRWRMFLASSWLKNERMTVSEAANRLGYDSEAAFSRAFKRFAGVPPSTLRGQRSATSAEAAL
ncbi:MAG: AraC family transcriptional regulator [Polyangiaceae bacterium]|nr:AraC family transcriptional regulator [Polyangiaceae bacterium]